MKTKFLIWSVLGTILFAQSCSKSSHNPTNPLVGTWTLSTKEYYGCPTASDNKTYTCGTFPDCSTITFKADMSFTQVSSADNTWTAAGKYTYSNNSLQLTYTNFNNVRTVYGTNTTTVSGNTLLVTEAPQGISCGDKWTWLKQ